MMDRIEEARRVFALEIEALENTKESLDDTFSSICDEILSCKGKVVWIGMGKSGHVAGKLAATMASLGTPSFALHPAEALHGDLGMISAVDVAIIISHSGESDEILRILPIIKLIGSRIVVMTGNSKSTLAKYGDIVMTFPRFQEACHMGLAPTSSTTAALAYGDALSVVLSKEKKFTKEDFGRLHPAGSLGKQLTIRVQDIMIPADQSAVVTSDVSLKEAIVSMSRLDLGIVTAVEKNQVIGILTDGDLRRLLENNADIYNLCFSEVMTRKPRVALEDTLAVDVLKMMKDIGFSSMPVIDKNENYLGIVTNRTIINAGIVTVR